jgi:hypothetical protein
LSEDEEDYEEYENEFGNNQRDGEKDSDEEF